MTSYIDYCGGLCHGVACLMNGIGMRCDPLTLLLVGVGPAVEDMVSFLSSSPELSLR